jgi:phosphate/sulfate permease
MKNKKLIRFFQAWNDPAMVAPYSLLLTILLYLGFGLNKYGDKVFEFMIFNLSFKFNIMFGLFVSFVIAAIIAETTFLIFQHTEYQDNYEELKKEYDKLEEKYNRWVSQREPIIEKEKQPPPWWFWIILVILLFLMIWSMFRY